MSVLTTATGSTDCFTRDVTAWTGLIEDFLIPSTTLLIPRTCIWILLANVKGFSVFLCVYLKFLFGFVKRLPTDYPSVKSIVSSVLIWKSVFCGLYLRVMSFTLQSCCRNPDYTDVYPAVLWAEDSVCMCTCVCVWVRGARSKGEVRRHTSTCEYFVPGVCFCSSDKDTHIFTLKKTTAYLIDNTQCSWSDHPSHARNDTHKHKVNT